MKLTKNLILLSIFILLIITGCNSEKSNNHSKNTQNNNIVSGLLAKGPIKNSIVEIRRLDTNALLARTKTNDKGKYSVSIGSFVGAVSVFSEGGKYIDEIDGQEKDATNVTLKAISVVNKIEGFIVNITPITSIAVKKLEKLYLNKDIMSRNEEAIIKENKKIAKILTGEDFNPTKITPNILGQDEIQDDTSSSKYGLLLASFAKLTNSDSSEVEKQIKQFEEAIRDDILSKEKAEELKDTLSDSLIQNNVSQEVKNSITQASNTQSLLDIIRKYIEDSSSSNPPTLEDYLNTTLSNINANNLDEINTLILSKELNEVSTLEQIQVLINSTIDTLAPTLTISDNKTGTINNSNKEITFTFAFTEDVTGFTKDDISLTNASKGVFTKVNDSTYTLNAIASDNMQEDITLSIISSSNIIDSSNNALITTPTLTYTQSIDTLAPTLTISDDKTGTINNSNKEITFTFAFTEDVTGFTKDDISLTNASKGVFTKVNDSTYTLNAIASDNMQEDITLSIISSSNIIDSSNNALITTPTLTYTQSIDTLAPTLTISDDKTGTINNSNKEITFTFAFTEDVTGFTTNDISLTNASKGVFTKVNDSTYTLNAIASDNMQEDITLSIISSSNIIDSSNNALITTPTLTYTQSIDTLAPTLTISDNQINTLNNSNKEITFTFAFTEDVTGFTKDDISLTNASKGVFTKVNDSTYTLNAIASDNMQEDITLSIISSSNIIDSSNNALITTPTLTYTQSIDTLAPTLTISDDKTGTINNSNKEITFTFAFTEDVTGFTKDDISLTNASKGVFTKVNDSTYTLNAIASDNMQEDITLSIISSSNIIDSSNNALITTPTLTYTQSIDTLAPTLTISDDKTGTINNSNKEITFTFAFTEDVTGFTKDDISLTNASKGVFTKVNDSTYTLNAIASDNMQEDITLSIISSSNIIDSSNNALITTPTLTYTQSIDTLAPTLTISDDKTGTINNSNKEITFTFAFTEDVTGFTTNDISLTNASKGVFTKVNDSTYTLNAIASDNMQEDITLSIISSSNIIDSSNNALITTPTLTYTQSIDTLAPTLTISDDKTGTINNSNKEITFTFAFTEDVTGFTTNDISLTNASKGVFTKVNDSTYTLNAIASDNMQEDITLSIISSSNIIDSSNNALITTPTLTYTQSIDTLAPTLTISDDKTGTINNSNKEITFTFAFTEDVTGFTTNDISLTNASKGVFTKVNDSTYTLNAIASDNMQEDITLSIISSSNIIDSSNNALITTPTLTYTQSIDTLAPTLTISDNQINTLNNSNKEITFTFAFTEDVTGFTKDDISLTNASKGVFTKVNDSTYTLNAIASDNMQEDITLSIISSSNIIDSSNNALITTPTLTYTQSIDTLAPTLTISDDKTGTINNSNKEITFTFAFTEDVTGFTKDDISLTNASKGVFTKVNDSTYTLNAIASDNMQEDITLSIISSSNIIDSSNNALITTPTLTYTQSIDTLAPTLTISDDKTGTINNSNKEITFTFAFTEDVTGFTTNDISLTNASKGVFTKVNDSTYTLNAIASDNMQEDITLSIISSSNIIDSSNNALITTPTLTYTQSIDTLAPTLTISDDKTGTINNSNKEITFTFAFTEDVTGFTKDDISLTNASKGVFTKVNDSTYTLNAIASDNMQEDITLSIISSSNIIDSSNNALITTPTLTYTQSIDTLAPTLTISDDKTGTINNSNKEITFTFAFTEDVTGFTTNDISLTNASKGVFTKVNDSTYTLNAIASDNMQEDITLSIISSSNIIDSSNNALITTPTLTYTQSIDTLAPTLTISDDKTGTINNSNKEITFTFAFTEDVTGFTTNDISLTNASKGVFTKVNDSTYTLNAIASDNMQEDITLSIISSSNIIDSSNNALITTPTLTYTQSIDTLAPTLTISDNQINTLNNSNKEITFTFAFTEDVTGFTKDDISLTNASKGVFTKVNDSTYTLNAIASDNMQEDITLSIISSSNIIDSSNNALITTPTLTYTQSIDTLAPTLTISDNKTGTINNSNKEITFTFAFTEDVTGFTKDDISLTNASKGVFTKVNDSTYTLNAIASDNMQEDITLSIISSSNIIDSSNNALITTPTLTYTQSIDTLAPTLTISDDKTGTINNSNKEITFTFAFTEDVTGFTKDDISLTNASKGVFTKVNDSTYTLNAIASDNMQEDITLSIISSSNIIDSSNNALITTPTLTYTQSIDTLAPTLTISDDKTGTINNSNKEITFTFAFTEDVTGFTKDDISLTNASKGVFTKVNDSTYTLNAIASDNMQEDITLSIISSSNIIDSSNNALITTPTLTYTQSIDTLAPTLTISDDKTGTINNSNKEITFTFAFTEDVTGFTTNDISLTNASKGVFTKVNDSTYTLNAIASDNMQEDITLSIISSSNIIDSSNNALITTPTLTYTQSIDTLAPTLTISDDKTGTINNSNKEITFTFAFTEDVTGFTTNDISLTNASKGVFTKVNDSTYTLNAIASDNMQEDITLSIISSSNIIDSSNNALITTPTLTYTQSIDTLAPTLTISDDKTGTINNSNKEITFTFAFTEDVTGFTTNDISLTNASKGVFTKVNDSTYTLNAIASDNMQEDITLSIISSSNIIDSSNNALITTPTLTYTQSIDTLAPTLTISDNQINTLNNSNKEITFTFAFTEDVTGFTKDDISLTNASKGVFTKVNDSTYTLNAIASDNMQEDITLSIISSSNIIDSSNNALITTPTLTYTQSIDTLAPTLTISDDKTGTINNSNKEITFTFAFTEDVTGFTTNDISLTNASKGVFTKVNDSTYTLNAIASDNMQEDITLSIISSSNIIDSSNNALITTPTLTYTQSIDTLAPTLTISDNQINTLNNSNKEITFTFAFTEDVTGFTKDDISLTNASKGVFTKVNDSTYTLNAIASDNMQEDITLSIISSSNIIDSSNNALITTPTLTYTQSIDTLAPTLTISDDKTGTINNSNKEITFTFAFTEDVTGFTTNDISLTNASKGVFTKVNDSTYTLNAIASDNMQEDITLSIISSSNIIDSSNNALITTPTLTYTQSIDTLAPTLTISDDKTGTINNSNKEITFTFAFTEDVTGFTTNDISLTNASKGVFTKVNDSTYTLNAIASDNMQEDITLSIISSSNIIDSSNNALITTPTLTYTQSIDTLAPTLTISDDKTGTINNSNKEITFTFAFTEDVTGFTTNDISLTNASKGVFTKVNDSTYTLNAIASDNMQEDITLSIISSSNIIDSSNNALITTPTLTYTQSIDTLAPTLTISDNQINTLNNSNKEITFTFAFTEDVTGFTKDDISLTNASKGVFTKVNDSTYTLNAIASDNMQEDITLSIISSSNIIDSSNNALITTPTLTYTQSIDTLAPTLTISDDKTGTINNSNKEITFTFAFTEDVTGFTKDDISLTNASKGVFTKVNDSTYTLNAIASDNMQEDITLSIISSSNIIDSSNNALITTPTLTYTQSIDTLAPTLTISDNQINTLNNSNKEITFTFAFTEDVTGFTKDDISLTNASKGVFTKVNDSTYTLNAIASDNMQEDITLSIISSSNIIDSSNNALITTPTLTYTQSIDTLAPTLTISDDKTGTINNSNKEITFTFAFTEDVTGFTTNDISLTNASKGVFTKVNDSTYTLNAIASDNMQEDITLSIISSSNIIDSSNNALITTPTLTYTQSIDTLAPTLTISDNQINTLNNSNKEITFTFAFTEDVTGFTKDDISLTNASKGVFTKVNDSTYTLNAIASDNMQEDITLSIISSSNIIDSSNNALITTPTLTYTQSIDTLAPTLTISDDKTGTINNSNKEITFTFAFTEDVTGFTTNDISLTNASKGVFTKVNDSTYTLNAIASDNMQEDITLSIISSSNIIDSSNNALITTPTLTYTQSIDTLAPTLTISDDKTGTINNSNKEITFTFAFTEDVTGFTKDDISLTNASKGVFTKVNDSTYTLNAIASDNMQEDITLSIISSSNIIDSSNNALITTPTLTYTQSIDTLAPTLTISDDKTGTINNSNKEITFTFAFTEDVTGFTKDDISLTNASKGVFTKVNDSTYTLNAIASDNMQEDITLSIISSSNIIDSSNNALITTPTLTYTQSIDTLAPTLTISDDKTGTINNSNKEITFTFAFTEDVTGFTKDDISLTNASKGVFTKVNDSTYTLNAIASDNMQEDITLSIISSSNIIDSSNNALITTPTLTYTQSIDTLAPTLTISDDKTGTINNSNKEITFTFAFTEDVTGFTTNDISLTNASKGVFTKVNDSTYTLNAIASDNMQEDITLSIISSSNIIDSSNNALITTPTLTYTQSIDTLAPTLTISDDKTGTINNSNKEITFTFAFTEDVTGFTKDDISLTNASKGVFTKVNDSTYTLNAIASDNMQEDITLSIISSSNIIDSSNNALITTPTLTYTQSIDTLAPTLTISDDKTGTINNSNKEITFTFAFTEDVTGFTTNDISLTNASKGVFTKVNDSTYTLNAIASDNMQEDITLSIISSSNIIDSSNNALITTPTLTYTQSIDTLAPSIVSLSFTSNAKTYVSGDDINISVVFNENVIITNTPSIDIKIGNNTKQASYVSGSGASTLVFTYTVVSGDEDTNGIEVLTNTLVLNTGSIKDVVGNSSTLTHSAISQDSSRKVDTPTLNILSHTNNQNISIKDALNIILSGTSNVEGKGVIISHNGTELETATVLNTTWTANSISFLDGKSRTYINGGVVSTDIVLFHEDKERSLKAILDRNKSSTGSFDYRVHPTNADGKYISIKFPNTYVKGVYRYYNRVYCCNKRVEGSRVKFLLNDIILWTSKGISNAGNIVTITPPEHIVFDEVKIVFSGWGQNFREIEVDGIPFEKNFNLVLKVTDDTNTETVENLNLNIGLNLASTSVNEGDTLDAEFANSQNGSGFVLGLNKSPQLTWGGASSDTTSYAIIMDDTTTGASNWIHWNVFNIPVSTTSLVEHWSATHANADVDGIQQRTAQGITNPLNKYVGPWPPAGGGTHTYQIKVYALKSTMPILDGTNIAINTVEFEAAHAQHIINSSILNFNYTNP